MGVFVNNVRDIGQCRVIIIITIIIITLFTVMKSGAPLLGLAKYIYYASTAYVVASYGPRFCSLPTPRPLAKKFPYAYDYG